LCAPPVCIQVVNRKCEKSIVLNVTALDQFKGTDTSRITIEGMKRQVIEARERERVQ